MRKAFDVINFEILLSKLNLYGCHSSTINWFKSYISKRSQFVINDEYTSETLFTSNGVPQGSILGPLLFILYINDFPLCAPNASVHMYADDSNLDRNGKSIKEVETLLTKDLADIEKWCYDSRLIINANKTESMLITTSQRARLNDMCTLNLLLENVPLSCTNKMKILGVTLDDRLKFDHHINDICTKISRLSGMLWRIKDFIPHSTKILFYNSHILPMNYYCINVWGHCSNCHLERIYKMQKRVLRIITDDYNSDAQVLFNQLKIMTVYERVEFKTAMLVYKCLNETTPGYLQSIFEFSGTDHNYNLRNVGINLKLPKPNTELYRKSFCYAGAAVWNNLPMYIKDSLHSPFNMFKSCLKCYIFSKPGLS